MNYVRLSFVIRNSKFVIRVSWNGEWLLFWTGYGRWPSGSSWTEIRKPFGYWKNTWYFIQGG